MPTYRIVFANGEKRDLVCKASEIRPSSTYPGMLRLVDDKEGRIVALAPLDKVLYVVDITDD